MTTGDHKGDHEVARAENLEGPDIEASDHEDGPRGSDSRP